MDSDIMNTMEPRMRWAICLGPTGNLQGSYKFLSLTTGKWITRLKFTEMPMTDNMMKQIKKWAVKDHAQKGLMSRIGTVKNMNLAKTTTRIHQLCALKKHVSQTYLQKILGY